MGKNPFANLLERNVLAKALPSVTGFAAGSAKFKALKP